MNEQNSATDEAYCPEHDVPIDENGMCWSCVADNAHAEMTWGDNGGSYDPEE